MGETLYELGKETNGISLVICIRDLCASMEVTYCSLIVFFYAFA